MPMHGRMPIIATTESRSEFARRCHVRVAVQNVTDLIRVFLVDAGQGELCESFRGFFIKRGCSRIFGGDKGEELIGRKYRLGRVAIAGRDVRDFCECKSARA